MQPLFYGNTTIGEIPDAWQKVKLDDTLVDSLGGFSCAKQNTVPTGVAHLRPFNVGTDGEVKITYDTLFIPTDFRNDLENFYLQPGDVLYNNTNSVELVGKTGIVRNPMKVAFSNHINRLRVKNAEQIDPRWLALSLRSLQNRGFFATHCNKWIGQAGFSISSLADVEIPLPSLAEQRRIVARIEALFAELRECRETLGELRKETGRLMEAVRHEVFNALSQTEKTKLFDEVADSRLGKMLNQDAQRGTNPKPYLRNANVLWDKFLLDDVLEMDFTDAEEETFRLHSGDLLICEGGDIGRTAVWEEQLPECYFQKALHRARLRDSKSSPRYLMHYMAWATRNGAIAKLRTGAAIPHLTGVKLKTLNVIWPEPQIQIEVTDYLDSVGRGIKEMQDTQQDDCKWFQEMEQAILNQAFRGEL